MADGRRRPGSLPGKAQRALCDQCRGVDRGIGVALLAAAAMLVAGAVLPVLNVRQLFIFSDRFSILDAVRDLFVDGQYFLAVVILLFSVVFPLGKTLLAAAAWRMLDYTGNHFRRVLALLDVLGKWSLADVLVVALVIVVVKSNGLSDAEAEPGLYVFAGAVFLTAVTVHRLKRVATGLGKGERLTAGGSP